MRTFCQTFIIVSVLTAHSCQIAFSQTKYKVSDIPKELLANAKAVIRNDETSFEIADEGKAVMKISKAITILNQNGIESSVFHISTNKFLSLKKFEWEIYDQNGERKRKNSSIELKDYSAISGYSLYEDFRLKLLDPDYRSTPFTVEYKYELDLNGLLGYPSMQVYEDFNVSVEKKSFKVSTPADFQLRYLEKRLPANAVIKKGPADKKENGGKYRMAYEWTIAGMPALKEEPFSLPVEEYTPVVYLGPDNFLYSDQKGNLSTWKNFALWISELNQGRDELSEESQAKIMQLITGKTTDREKIKAIYEYMQEKVRYVNITVGIGGFRTIDAETVDRLSYGDCKALSNYMISMLKVAGIKGYFTLAKAGSDAPSVLREFPLQKFNHVIVCIPEKVDTLWLECTSQHVPCGYIGTFTDDRFVLLTGEEGGSLVRTKKYLIDDNQQTRKATVNLTADGNGEASVSTEYTGILCDDIYSSIYRDDIFRKKSFEKRIPVKSYNLGKYSYREKKDLVPSVFEDIEMTLPNYCSASGNRMFFVPDLMTRFGKVPSVSSARISPVHIKRPYIEKDTVVFNIPAGYRVEQVPENKSIKTKFGEYRSSVSYDKTRLIFMREFKLFGGDYPPADYPEFVSFCEKTAVADERKAVLQK
jgi:hypothetical protein